MSTNGSNGKTHPWTVKALREGAESVVALGGKMASFAKAFRSDGWANLSTGLNTSFDKSSQTLPYTDAILPQLVLEQLYHGDDIAARIVSAVPDECFREPWDVYNKSGDNDGEAEEVTTLHDQASELETQLDKLGTRQKMREAMVWGRLYGLGAILVGAQDGQEPWEELNIDGVTSVDYLTVLDKRDLIPWRWYGDPTKPKFGDVAIYQVQPTGVYLGSSIEPTAAGNQIILVHESRLIRFGGELTSRRERMRNQGSDYSVLQKCFRALQLTNNNWQSASALLSDASQGVFKINGLIDMVTQQPDVMVARMQLVDQLRSVCRGLVLDTTEDFERKPTPFNGIPDMLEQTWKRLATAAKMPLTILMGQSPAGLNATGESDIRWWYDTIAAIQRDSVLPQVDKLLCMLAAVEGYPEPESWSVKFAPLWQMSSHEKADMELKTAQKDQLYMQEGVLLPEEVALSRFGDSRWSDETKIDVDARKEVLDIRKKQQKAEAQAAVKLATNPPPPPPVVMPGKQPPPPNAKKE